MSEITIAGYVPGAIGRVAELQATYYSRAWDFGLYFEAKVAFELSEFLRRFDAATDGFWTANRSGRVEGSIAIDGASAKTEGAHLRWFILSDAVRVNVGVSVNAGVGVNVGVNAKQAASPRDLARRSSNPTRRFCSAAVR